jgi:hypothetical protein
MPYRNKDLEVATAATIQASMARAGSSWNSRRSPPPIIIPSS